MNTLQANLSCRLESLEAQVAGIKFEKQMLHEWDLPTEQDSGTEEIKRCKRVQAITGRQLSTMQQMMVHIQPKK